MKICIIGGGTTGWWAAKYLEQNKSSPKLKKFMLI